MRDVSQLTKQEILYMFLDGDYDFYDDLPEDMKKDYDICDALLRIEPGYIFDIPRDAVNFRDLLFVAVEMDPYLIKDIFNKIIRDDELFYFAFSKNPSVMFLLGGKYVDEKLYNIVEDITKLNFDSASYEDIIKIIHFDSFNTTDKKLCSFISRKLLDKINNSVDFNYNDKKTIEVLVYGIDFENEESIFKSDPYAFSALLSKIQYINRIKFNGDLNEIIFHANGLLRRNGKENTLEKNPIFSYDLIKYVLPVFGDIDTLDLIAYNTDAPKLITNLIKNGKSEEIKRYYNMFCRLDIFPNDKKRIHYAFRSFDVMSGLIFDLVEHENELTESDIETFRKVIINRNTFDIKSLKDLRNYNECVKESSLNRMNSNDIVELKNALSVLFGYDSVSALKREFTGLQLNNYHNLGLVRRDIIEKYGGESEKILNECFYNSYDVSLVKIMESIIFSVNIDEVKDIYNTLVAKNNGVIDFSEDTLGLVTKIKKLYNYHFNANLTKIEDIKSNRIEKDDPDNKYGVTIIDMDEEPFGFLVHRIYDFDPSMRELAEKLWNNPNLWYELEGSTTLSTSSISDKGFWFVENENSDGVFYLFNDMPSDFLQFMNGRDVWVEHKGFLIEPTSKMNTFTTWEGVNQAHTLKECDHNEIAGFRKGVSPCAFACMGDEPNEATLKAAKYFSEVLGKDIPIIRFNIKAYNDKKIAEYQKNKESFLEKPTIEAMHGIFFDGIKKTRKDNRLVFKPHVTARYKANYCLNILLDKFNNGELTFAYFTKLLMEMESYIKQIFLDYPYALEEGVKIAAFRRTLAVLVNQYGEGNFKIEKAYVASKDGFYKCTLKDKSFLIMPAHSKKDYVPNDYKAEVQVASNTLEERIMGDYDNVDSYDGKGKKSIETYIEISKDNCDYLKNWVKNGGPLDIKYSNQLLKQYVIDFMLCNFETSVDNFVLDSNDNVRVIDRKQSFRYMNKIESYQADYSYSPNEKQSIYNILFERFKTGEIDLDLSIITDTVNEITNISSEEYKEMFAKYAVYLSPEKSDEILSMIDNRRIYAKELIDNHVEYLGSFKKGRTY